MRYILPALMILLLLVGCDVEQTGEDSYEVEAEQEEVPPDPGEDPPEELPNPDPPKNPPEESTPPPQ